MNKLAIPAVLAATIMIAGIFAFMPVEKATTVHDQIIAALQGANIVRIQTHIDNIESTSTPQGTGSEGDNNGSITWTQIVTYDRVNSNGAFQIEKLFICDFESQDSPPTSIGFDVETDLIDENSTGGSPSLVSHVNSGDRVMTILTDSFYDDRCVDIKNAAMINPGSDSAFINTHLGGDQNNDVNVRMLEPDCDFNGTDTNGAYLVAYIVGLVDGQEMDVFVDDTVANCD